MRQYTTPEQTVKLVELGFEKPKGLADAEPSSGKWVREAYSIGELLDMLPMNIKNDGRFEEIIIHPNYNRWVVKYSGIFREPTYQICRKELIDALYTMIVELKEEGVI